MTIEIMVQCLNSDIDTLKGLLNRGMPNEDKIKKEIEIKTAIIETLQAECCLDCVSRAAVLEITAETGALETQNRVMALPLLPRQ